MSNRILIAEDEARLREVLCDFFVSKGDVPVSAANGAAALELANEDCFDAVLLDIMMPELDGFSVCRTLRRNSDMPIILLTALSDEEDKVFGYELGADDYITKPFSLSVLYAKVSALIKRSRGSMRMGDVISVGELKIQLSKRKVFACEKEVQLTPKEYAILECLLKNKNIAMSREQILVKCWGYDFEGESRVVDTQIKRLREKLGDYASCIKTVIKVGYKLEG